MIDVQRRTIEGQQIARESERITREQANQRALNAQLIAAQTQQRVLEVQERARETQQRAREREENELRESMIRPTLDELNFMQVTPTSNDSDISPNLMDVSPTANDYMQFDTIARGGKNKTIRKTKKNKLNRFNKKYKSRGGYNVYSKRTSSKKLKSKNYSNDKDKFKSDKTKLYDKEYYIHDLNVDLDDNDKIVYDENYLKKLYNNDINAIKDFSKFKTDVIDIMKRDIKDIEINVADHKYMPKNTLLKNDVSKSKDLFYVGCKNKIYNKYKTNKRKKTNKKLKKIKKVKTNKKS